MRQVGSVLWPKLRVLQIYGANTDVGKTICSTVLCKAFARRIPNVYYLKPVSTGSLDNADDRHISSYASKVQTRCLYQYDDPVGPHLAARSSGPVPDSALQIAVYDELQKYSDSPNDGIALVETAGGVLSPSPSGTSQADLYRPLRIPTLLLGDHKLGGISTTISSWEALHIRGYDVQSVALFNEDRYQNYDYLKDYFAERNVSTFSIEPPPERKAYQDEELKSMEAYYSKASQTAAVEQFADDFLEAHDRRIGELRRMPEEADKAIWHPFLQHRERSKDTIVAMDSAYGDYFETYTTKREHNHSSLNEASAQPFLKPAFDGSASWWTQGLGHGNPRLALTAAHAAGRYGHVMFAGAVHEPALTLAKSLLNNMGNPRLSKVFFSDNGSTGMEVAVKMALRAAGIRNKWTSDDEVVILGLTNSYHGDTIGTMDCSEPSIFNKKVEWYRGRGYWFDFPQVQMRKGKWFVQVPEALEAHFGPSREFAGLQQIFDFDGRIEDRETYKRYFASEIPRLQNEGKKLGALILEPVVLGAGGMMFADPLFQRCLVETVRVMNGTPGNKGNDWSGMPVIFDEVFTGLYRLGRFSAAGFLDVDPDVVVNAKLLTGGLLPLCTTTASQSVFDAFLSDDKSDALLHGHSYTAHAVGCAVANESLSAMERLHQSSTWDGFRKDWKVAADVATENTSNVKSWSMWSQDFVHSLSHKTNVDHVWTLGSVLAISMKDSSGSGYASTAAIALRDQLLAGEIGDDWVVHSRVLGNVLYLMAAMTTSAETLRGLQERVLNHIK